VSRVPWGEDVWKAFWRAEREDTQMRMCILEEGLADVVALAESWRRKEERRWEVGEEAQKQVTRMRDCWVVCRSCGRRWVYRAWPVPRWNDVG
jgi:hypothetical protein